MVNPADGKYLLSHQYFTDREYEDAFFRFGNVRTKIVGSVSQHRPLRNGVILDLLSGHGLLSAEISVRFPDSKIIGTGLINDVESWSRLRKSDRYSKEAWSNFHYLLCDVTNLPVRSSSCDIVVNFLGLEDLHMTSGRHGIKQAIREIDRVTKNDAVIQISLVEYGDTPEEKIARDVWQSIGLNAVFLEETEYLELFNELNIHPVDEYTLTVDRKMTAQQAKEELRFACEEAPMVFSAFNVETLSFDELWESFGERIEEHGLAYWSQIRVILLSKE